MANEAIRAIAISNDEIRPDKTEERVVTALPFLRLNYFFSALSMSIA